MDRIPQPPPEVRSEVAAEADFSLIRYAQCWEDTDVLLEALAIRPGDACFSVGSGGDNTLAMLSRDPSRVVAVDLSPAQNAVLELKAAGFAMLGHDELLELVGAAPSARRARLYAHARNALPPAARAYWDARARVIERGLSAAGKFERYFALFRRVVLPLVHSRRDLDALFEPRDAAGRRRFYDERWNNRRWRALFRAFFSRRVMGWLGRDTRFFRYAEGDVAERILARTEHALAELDPSSNPYLHWIAYGRFGSTLPYVWRAENHEPIRRNLARLEVRLASVESSLAAAAGASLDRFNLSDVFEYLSPEASDAVFADVARCARPGARVAYWNMMAPRRRPEALAGRLRPLEDESRRFHSRAATFFYGAFEVDQAEAPRA
jgi:S-adenosylmethionine-diacylglycerol 3-amino-3-carboxypropyl transferase